MRLWKISQLEREFRNRWGRDGVWANNQLPFYIFLSCFHKTFEVFGENHEYVRIRHPWARLTQSRIIDNPEKVMVNLARLGHPDLMIYQKKMHLNTEHIEGAYDKRAPNNLFKIDLKLKRAKIPTNILASEERALYAAAGRANGKS